VVHFLIELKNRNIVSSCFIISILILNIVIIIFIEGGYQNLYTFSNTISLHAKEVRARPGI
jgi:hypothetical protein